MSEVTTRLLFSVCAVFCLMFSENIFAADCNHPPGDAGYEGAKINYQCAERDRRAADSKLNQAYKKLLGALKDDPDSGLIPRTQIVSAQRTWVAFRDAECDFRTSVSGGAHQWLIVNHAQCLAELTEQRTKVLEDYLKRAQDE
ncbi:lysozyme inhibitor LprI family protein [Burkholderia ubonensis]|uniref:lysozyme inhibitor LprI family protein n=1 Tax=Burkholderia ubonensis TaxID=101571 RepID=UPI0009AE7AB6|nr:lysozyme inhibitor LprI family protein [Burkholderia ubonensis]